MQHTQPKPERIWYLDLLRIIATFAVVTLHINSFALTASPLYTARYWIANAVTSACRFAVPVFFMISGALFLSPQKKLNTAHLYKRTILRMGTCFLFWSALYAFTYCYHTNAGKWTFLNETFRGHYHMWFILVITGLYILTPLLRMITQHARATRHLLLLCFVFGFLIPRLFSFILLFDFPHKDVVLSLQPTISQLNPLSESYALFYYIMGYYLHANPPSKKIRTLIAICGAAGFFMTMFLGAMHQSLIGEFSSHFYDSPALGAMLMGVAVFTFFGKRFSAYRPSAHTKRLITHLSSCSFGVYVVHIIFLEHISPILPATPLGLLPGILISTLTLYAVSHITSFMLHCIPVLRDWVV